MRKLFILFGIMMLGGMLFAQDGTIPLIETKSAGKLSTRDKKNVNKAINQTNLNLGFVRVNDAAGTNNNGRISADSLLLVIQTLIIANNDLRIIADSVLTLLNSEHRVATGDAHSTTPADIGAVSLEDSADAYDYLLRKYPEANAQTGTTYTLVLTDDAKVVTLSNGSAITVTVPLNAAVAFPTMTAMTFINIGAGTVTFSFAGTWAGSVTTLDLPTGKWATILKLATDTWAITGGIE